MLKAQLKDVPIFSTLSKRELTEVAQQTDDLDVAEGKTLAREGDIGHEFFLIAEGIAEVTRGGSRVAELGPGDFFGEMALLGEDRRTATVTATSPMRVIVMTRQSFRTIDRTMPSVHAKIAEAIEARRPAGEPASS
jgi:CRP/FNR family transcriptional regulator, cyclic AMP receptor protein